MATLRIFFKYCPKGFWRYHTSRFKAIREVKAHAVFFAMAFRI